jgi:hypothetical protein
MRDVSEGGFSGAYFGKNTFSILALQDIGQLKRGRSKFRVYLENNRVYINKAQLGEGDGIILGLS